ncbi:MAG: hypothetical protein DRP78_05450 [Candidatus Omnitrophota bacterium]|nr:MAG: hypothetical protein DRP78_05450 [Candidatus Omnitrophota bacterium]
MTFEYIARASCGELRSQLFIAKEIGYIDKEQFKQLYNKAKDVSKQINGFIEYLKTTKILGQKFKNKQSR